VAKACGITLPVLPAYLTDSLTAGAGADPDAAAVLGHSAAADATPFERDEHSPEPCAELRVGGDLSLSHSGHAAAVDNTRLVGARSGASCGLSSAHARTVPLRGDLHAPEKVHNSSSAAILGAPADCQDANDDSRPVA
jgi:phage tail tape-measure protein